MTGVEKAQGGERNTNNPEEWKKICNKTEVERGYGNSKPTKKS